jgi:hypothetical protein
LVLKISKEIGAETGRLEFSGVSLINLAPQFTVDGLAKRDCSDGDWLFTFEEAWGESYSVIAESVVYEIE